MRVAHWILTRQFIVQMPIHLGKALAEQRLVKGVHFLNQRDIDKTFGIEFGA
jgi:hypothetical protein